MTKIKICGITNLNDALRCAEAGADALGFVFAPSPRQVAPQVAAKICERIPDSISRVGVFVNENPPTLLKIARDCQLDYVQLHGQEDQEYFQLLNFPFVKVFQVRNEAILSEIERFQLKLFILDSFVNGNSGGSGRSFDWDIAVRARRFGQFILCGGLSPENGGSALQRVRPYGVDVSTGVEKFPGRKDLEKVKKFIQEVKRWDSRIN
jgi:phosphoribosylanthranilate isomerase